MASMGLPSISLLDSPADNRDDQYEQAFCRRVHARQDEVVDRFLELLADHCYRRDGNPLAEMHALLSGPGCAPILNGYDARQYSQVGRPDDRALACLVRYLYAVANVSVAEAVRNELADTAF